MFLIDDNRIIKFDISYTHKISYLENLCYFYRLTVDPEYNISTMDLNTIIEYAIEECKCYFPDNILKISKEMNRYDELKQEIIKHTTFIINMNASYNNLLNKFINKSPIFNNNDSDKPYYDSLSKFINNFDIYTNEVSTYSRNLKKYISSRYKKNIENKSGKRATNKKLCFPKWQMFYIYKTLSSSTTAAYPPNNLSYKKINSCYNDFRRNILNSQETEKAVSLYLLEKEYSHKLISYIANSIKDYKSNIKSRLVKILIETSLLPNLDNRNILVDILIELFKYYNSKNNTKALEELSEKRGKDASNYRPDEDAYTNDVDNLIIDNILQFAILFSLIENYSYYIIYKLSKYKKKNYEIMLNEFLDKTVIKYTPKYDEVCEDNITFRKNYNIVAKALYDKGYNYQTSFIKKHDGFIEFFSKDTHISYVKNIMLQEIK